MQKGNKDVYIKKGINIFNAFLNLTFGYYFSKKNHKT